MSASRFSPLSGSLLCTLSRFNINRCSYRFASPSRSFSHYTPAELYEQEDHHFSSSHSSTESSSIHASGSTLTSQVISVQSVASPVSLPPVAHLHASAAALEPSSSIKTHLAISDYEGDNHVTVMETAGFNLSKREW